LRRFEPAIAGDNDGRLLSEALCRPDRHTASGKVSRADIVGFDIESGLGLLRAADPLEVKSNTAGVRHGDRVTAIDGSPVDDLAGFYRALWGRGVAGITVKLTVMRQGEERQIEVKTIDRYRYLKLDTTY
jgi:S1-C subfamily serine protease